MKSSLGNFLATRIGIGAVTVSMICVGATHNLVTTPDSVTFEVKPLAAIVESPNSIGVADPSLYFESTADVNTTLDALQSLGVRNVRIQIPWAAVQTFGPGSYDWAATDRMIDAATARNMGVLGVLNATPAWAGSPYLTGQPNPQAYATFASAVASRYAGKISAYEIWNEPNSYTFFSPVDPSNYTQLLKAAYPAIKAADPLATVIGGVVGAVTGFGNLAMSPQDFIAGMYSAGARGSFDALSFHPYQFLVPFSAGEFVADSPLNQLRAIWQIMVANGDAALKIWATEYGEPTSVVTQVQQAAYIKDFLTTWQTEAGAGPIFLHTTRDAAVDISVNDALGLFSADWAPKLAAQMIKNFIAGIPDATPPAIAVDAITALLVAVNQITGIPLRVVSFVIGVVRNVIDTVTGAIQGVRAFAQGVAEAITARLVPPAQLTPTPLPNSGSPVRAAAAPAPQREDPAPAPPSQPAAVEVDTATVTATVTATATADTGVPENEPAVDATSPTGEPKYSQEPKDSQDSPALAGDTNASEDTATSATEPASSAPTGGATTTASRSKPSSSVSRPASPTVEAEPAKATARPAASSDEPAQPTTPTDGAKRDASDSKDGPTGDESADAKPTRGTAAD